MTRMFNIYQLCILLMLSFFFCTMSFADSNQALISYNNGNYQESLQYYQSMDNDSKTSGEWLFNVGNIYYKLGEVGKAIFYFKKALEVLPRDGDVKHNLEMIEKKIIDKVEDKRSFFVKSMSLKALFNFKEQIFIAAIFFFIGVMSIIVRIYKKTESLLLMVITSFLLSFFVSVFVLKDYLLKQDIGVVIKKEAVVKSSTGSSGVELFVLHEGSSCFLLKEELDDHLLIELADGKKGWIFKKDLIYTLF